MNDRETEMESGRALQECICDLGIPSSFVAVEVEVEFLGSNGRQVLGSTSVTFRNGGSGELPYMEPHYSMKSFEIFVGSFKPLWEIFRYDNKRKELSISGKKFRSFTIRFL